MAGMVIEMRANTPYINGKEAVGIIRCEDCEYSTINYPGSGLACLCPEALSVYGHPLGMQNVKPDHFCAYGK